MQQPVRDGRGLVGLKAASPKPLQTTGNGTPEGVPFQSPSPSSSSATCNILFKKRVFHAGLKDCSIQRLVRSLLVFSLLLLQLCNLPVVAQEDSDTESWFSLTSSKTFLSGEKPEI